MTLTANFALRRFQQKVPWRCVRSVAVYAAFVVEHGPMHRRFIESINHHVVMATLAELEADLLESERRRRRRLGVTLATCPLADRLVNIVEQQARSVRTVRIVARGAAGFLHGVVFVYLPERCIVCLVAIETQRGLRVHEKLDALFRCVGIVAIHAAIRHGVVFEFVGCDLLGQIPVTFDTEFTSRSDQVHLVLGAVRVMA